jgi:hypothetical protein
LAGQESCGKLYGGFRSGGRGKEGGGWERGWGKEGVTLIPTAIGERPWNGILPVAISHRMMAKLYMSHALLSMSSGLCPRTAESAHRYYIINAPFVAVATHIQGPSSWDGISSGCP